MSAKSKVRPHPFLPGPADEADSNGRTICRQCHLIGQPRDNRHTLPAATTDARQLAAGDND